MLNNSIKFRADIQGLRAIAVLSVLLFHFDKNILPAGFVGVDIFFVISVFLITSILVSKKQAKNLSLKLSFVILKDFYLSRIRRIVPAYFVVLIFVAIFAAVLFIPQDFSFFYKSFKRTVFFLSNQYFAGFGDYFAPSSYELPLLHTWSLAIEMQFYLIYPFIILFLPTKLIKILILPVALVLFAISEYFLHLEANQAVYYSLNTRIPEFLLGASAFLFLNNANKKSTFLISTLGFILLIVGFFVINSESKFPGLLSILPTLGASLIILGNSNKNVFTRFLSIPILVWIGAISYSLYLWHWVNLAFMRYLIGSYDLNFLQIIICGGGAFVFASLSYCLIEQKFRKSNVSKLLWILLFALVGLLLAFLPKANSFTNSPIPVEFTRYKNQAEICHGDIVGDCVRGSKTSLKNPILVIGDSHAAMLNIFFDYVGNKEDLKFKVITGSSCVPIKNFDYKRIEKWAHSACKSQIAFVNNQLEKANNIILAGMWEYHFDSIKFKNALKTFFIENADKKILVLADIPHFENYKPLRSFHLKPLHLDFSNLNLNPKIEKTNFELENLVKKLQNARFINLTKNNALFKKLPFYEGKLMYADSHHLNEVGSLTYAQTSLVELNKNLKWFFNNKSE